MKVVIDTSSLIALVRYYLPFDKRSILFDFFKAKIESQEIVVLDKVVEECRYTAKGIALASMDILNDKKIQVSTAEILPNRKFFNQVENQFINGAAKNRLNASEFESMKSRFLESADAKLILYTLNYQNSNNKERIIIVTEETEVSNDNKGFKKIPAICGILQLETLTLPNLLILYNGINIEYQ